MGGLINGINSPVIGNVGAINCSSGEKIPYTKGATKNWKDLSLQNPGYQIPYWLS
ncbi:MAG: hypothetical protein Q8941_05225 [Bacteroidota bacterium]|nr:hypothetical protein [Bacteroidota bacterium]